MKTPVFIKAFSLGIAAMITSSCLFSVGAIPQPIFKPDPKLPPLPDNWQEAFDASTLPALQTNTSGSTDTEWRYANAVLGAEVWIIDSGADSAGGASSDVDDFEANPSLLDIPLTETGWPKELPEGYGVQISSYYSKKASYGLTDDRTNMYEFLTGVYVVTWKGSVLPEGSFSITDLTNDGDPVVGTVILPTDDPRRVLALVRDPGRGIQIHYNRPDPADPVRDIKMWTPVEYGAGLGLDFSEYIPETMGPGKITASTEPAPGNPAPRWHPKYLEHLAGDASGVLRFMGFLEINGLSETEPPLAWSDRMPETVTLTRIVGIDPANYIRHPLASFPGRCRIPYEWLLDLAAVARKDAWLQVPHSATDDHIEGLARLAARTLPAERRAWFEFSNELWNGYGPYLPQYHAAEAEGSANGRSQGWGSGRLQAHALSIFERAWAAEGGSDDRLVNVLSGFAVSSQYNAEVLEGAESVGASIPEAFAITTYFGASLTEALYGLQYGAGNPSEQAYAEARELIRASIYRDFEAWQANADLCRDHGVGMIAYEGGSHILATGYGDWDNERHASFMTFLANLHRHPYMKELYLEHWALWCAAGGRTASLFVDIGSWGYYGYWGAKEDVTEPPDASPRWQAQSTFAGMQAGVRALGNPTGEAPAFSSPLIFSGEAGVALSGNRAISFGTEGGDGEISIVLMGGRLPEGVEFSAAGPQVRLTGTPAKLETARFVVRATDADGDPDYGIVTVNIDPAGTSAGTLVLFDPASLPESSLSEALGDENSRTRYDITDSRRDSLIDSIGTTMPPGISLPPGLYLPFDPSVPLFDRHFTNFSICLAPDSPFAFSGGWSETLLVDDFNQTHTTADAGSPVIWTGIRDYNTEPCWVGLRGKAFTGWNGISLDLPADATHPEQRRYGVPSRFDGLFIWRKEQTGASAGETVSFGSGVGEASFVLETGGFGGDEALIRFAIASRDEGGTVRWYLSEAFRNNLSPGRFMLEAFNDSALEGKRWAEFSPGSSTVPFRMPDAAELDFRDVDFQDVEGIGFALSMRRFGWHYGWSITRFLAVGRKTP